MVFKFSINFFKPKTNISKNLPAPRHRIKENSRLLPNEAIEIMTEWYEINYTNPYPNVKECEELAAKGKVSINQVKQWFVNVRRRTHNQYRRRRTVNVRKEKECEKKYELSTNDNYKEAAQTNDSGYSSSRMFQNNSNSMYDTSNQSIDYENYSSNYCSWNNNQNSTNQQFNSPAGNYNYYFANSSTPILSQNLSSKNHNFSNFQSNYNTYPSNYHF
jgi:hypothetical protein